MMTLEDLCKNVHMNNIIKNRRIVCLTEILKGENALKYNMNCKGIDCNECNNLSTDWINKAITKKKVRV